MQLRSARKRHRVPTILSSQGKPHATVHFTGPGRHRSLSVMRRMPPTLPKFLAVYAFLYAAFGVQSPFLPALLREQGLHAEEIGIVLAASTAIRVLAGPAIGHAADRLHRHTSILCGCALAAAVAGLGYLMMQGLGSLLVVGLLHAAMLAPIAPLSDALATTAAHESESDGRRRFDYGWLRASGSAAFIVGTTVSGWVAGKAGLGKHDLVQRGAARYRRHRRALLLPKLPGGDAAHNGARPPIVRDWALLFRLAVYRRVLIIAALVEGSHALHDAFSVIRWRSAGIDLPIVGLLWSESVLSEVVVFLLIGPRLVRQFGPGGACALAAGAGVVRWTVVAFTTDPVLSGLCAAPARSDIRPAAFGLHAADRAGGAGPSGSDGAVDLRHVVRWFGDRATHPGFRLAVRANGRTCVSRHGRALFAGAAAVRRAAPLACAGVRSVS